MAKARQLVILATILLFTIPRAANAIIIDPVEFQSHGATLSGSLVLPSNGPPVAAFVLIHGGGRIERMLPLARMLADDGFAVLTYDKRGVGKSGGTYEDKGDVSAANLDLLADDVVAALDAMAKDSRLPTIPIGLVGLSQAGWVAPIASIKSHFVKFMVLPSGPACTVSEQMYFQNWAMRDPDFWKTHTEKDVADYMKSVRYRSDDVDPRASIAKLSIPILWLYGGSDNIAPVSLSIARLDALREGHANLEYRLFPEYGHNLLDSRTQASYRYMIAWLKRTVAEKHPVN